jgi:hypothetical protein
LLEVVALVSPALYSERLELVFPVFNIFVLSLPITRPFVSKLLVALITVPADF